MKFLLAFVLGVLLITVESKPAAQTETEPANNQPIQLADRIKEAQELITNLGTQLQQQFNLPNQDELANTFKEQSKNLANTVQQYVANITEEVKNKSPELENLWENFKTKLNDMVQNLNVNQETTEQINQLRDRFQEGVQTIIRESENTAKAINENSAKVQEGISKMTKQAIDIAVQASQNLQNQLQHATTPQA